jgi:hypothetical protein
VGYYKCIIMVEVLVGMRKLRAEWSHRLESSWKDVVTWVTSNEGGSRTPNRHSKALSASASRVVVFYSEAVVMDSSQHQLPTAIGGGTWRCEVLSSLCRLLSAEVCRSLSDSSYPSHYLPWCCRQQGPVKHRYTSTSHPRRQHSSS